MLVLITKCLVSNRDLNSRDVEMSEGKIKIFKYKGEAELRITCHTTKIALQASRQERRAIKSKENGKIFEETTT